MSFFSELRRRNVIRTAATYLAIAWLIVQIVETLFPVFDLSEDLIRIVVVLLIIGFPLFLALSWFYEVTPEGVMSTGEADARGYTRPTGFGRQIDFVIIALLAVAVIWLVYDREAGPSIADNTIAVLPFQNLSGDPDQSYFSDGISEEILNVLAQVDGLKVIARTSAFQYRGESIDLRQVGRDLGVATVLEGSVRKSGDVVRITAQLIGTADGFQIWSENYDRQLDDVLKIQDEIAVAVVDRLRNHLDLGPKGIVATGRIRTSNEAYDLYMRGLYHMSQLFAPGQDDSNLDAPAKALEFFRRATEVAPDFAPAWAWRALALTWVAQASGELLDEMEEKPRDFIDRALQLGSELAEVQYVASNLSGGEKSLEHLDHAIALNPNYAAAHADRAVTLRYLERFPEYFEAAETSLSLNPLDKWAHYFAMYARFHSGRIEGLEEFIQNEYKLWPETNALVGEAHLRFELGQLEALPELQRRAVAINPQFGLEPPHWITSAPRHFGEAYLTLDLPERAKRFMTGRYEDVVDMYAGQYDKAIDHLIIEMDASKNMPPGWYRPYADVFASLAEAYLYSGRYVELANMDEWEPDWAPIAEMSFSLPQSENGNPPWPELAFAFALFETGQDAKAQTWLDGMAAIVENRLAQGVNVPNHYYELARIRVMQGRNRDAFAAMERAIEMGWRRWYFDRDPILEPIRELPEFATLKARYDADIARMRAVVIADFATNGPDAAQLSPPD